MLQRVAAALAGQAWVTPVVRPGATADFVVTTDPRGTAYRICDGSDVPIPVRPELPAADPASAPALVARLAHLARFLAVRALDNPDPLSPLRGKLVVELLQAPAGFQKGDPTAGLKPFPAGTVPRLAPGTWLVLQVTNRAAQPVNVVVLDLSSDWSVSVAHPDDRFLTVAPARSRSACRCGASCPTGRRAGATRSRWSPPWTRRRGSSCSHCRRWTGRSRRRPAGRGRPARSGTCWPRSPPTGRRGP